MRGMRVLGLWTGLILTLVPVSAVAQRDSEQIFAVITEVPEDKSRVAAQVLAGESVGEAELLADEGIQGHVMWRKLEMCQSIRAEVRREGNDYRVLSFKMVGAFMLPMALQGIAGDCLLKKAMQYAPLLE